MFYVCIINEHRLFILDAIDILPHNLSSSLALLNISTFSNIKGIIQNLHSERKYPLRANSFLRQKYKYLYM